MQHLDFKKNRINLNFVIDEDGRLLVSNIGTKKNKIEELRRFYVPAEIHISGTNPDDHHGCKHTGSSVSDDLRYVRHRETDSELVFELKSDMVKVMQHYTFTPGVDCVCAYTEVENISPESIGLEYVSSFCMYGFDIDNMVIPHSTWKNEVNWRRYTAEEIGYVKKKWFSLKRIAISNTGTWSTKEFLPMGIVENQTETILWQIESSGSCKISDLFDENYLKLSGPSEQENGWWKNLKPGECFQTVNTAICFGKDFNKVMEEMTRYRRTIAMRGEVDRALPVLFDDGLCNRHGGPTEERLIPVIDMAARMGAEVFILDAGWYAELDGTWWETVGEWQINKERFPQGLKGIFDYIRSKGMKTTLWLEPEVMGINCPILDQFDDSCFFMRHGKRVIDHGRYQFDLRNQKVRTFLDGVVDRLITELQLDYLRLDYNIEGGVGTEVNADSFGDGLLQYHEAYLDWIDGIQKRYPQLIIENCDSGGMRMDYKTLRHFSIQSVTDNMRYHTLGRICAMTPTAALPEQAVVWCVPREEHTEGEIAFSMVNTAFKRFYYYMDENQLSDSQMALVDEWIAFYKETRHEIPHLIPFWPMGLVHHEDTMIVSGYKGENKCYLCVGNLGDRDTVTVPLEQTIKECRICYPQKNQTQLSVTDKDVQITMESKTAVVIEVLF